MNNPFEVIEARLSSIENLILDLKHQPKTVEPNQPHEPELVIRKEALELLSTTPATLWRWEKQGKIKSYGIGGKRYYKRTELLEALTLKKG
jgi:hypothetical protein